jgi:tryptophan 7-halogenase
MQKIIIAGGGSAGWMAASYLAKFNKDYEVTVIEAPGIPIIGVGESVTPHVDAFFADLNIPRHEWMNATAAVYKLGNKFVNWKHGKGESEYFGFTYALNEESYFKNINKAKSLRDFRPRKSQSGIKNIHHASKMVTDGVVPRYDRWMTDSYHFMNKNVAFMRDGQNLFNEPWIITHHINAELTGSFLRERSALPAGVKRIQAKIEAVVSNGDNITELQLDNGDKVTANLFIDASGFHRCLIDKLNWEKHYYEDYPVDSAWVCQTEYRDQEAEMVNHTETIAEPCGWRFRLALYHRVGNGYVFSSKHISDEDALTYFKSQLKHDIKLGPKLIKWKPMRLKQFAKGNVISVGLSSGFIEPMEANAFYFIVNGIRKVSDLLRSKTNDWSAYNDLMASTMDHTHDFLLLHYTLTQREDTAFWKEQKARGARDDHVQFARDKSNDKNNDMMGNFRGTNLFADFMWMQMLTAWGHSHNESIDPTLHDLARHIIIANEKTRDMITDLQPNNFTWHQQNVFQGLTPTEWRQKYLGS